MNFKRLFIFLIIAFSISNIFRFDVFGTKLILEKLPNWIYLLCTVILEGSGVFTGALVAIKLLEKERKTVITFFGTSQKMGLLMSVIPIALLSIIGFMQLWKNLVGEDIYKMNLVT